MSHKSNNEYPAYFSENPGEGTSMPPEDLPLPAQEGGRYGDSQQTPHTPQRTASLRSNPPSAWKQDVRAPRVEDYPPDVTPERRPSRQRQAPQMDFSRPQRRVTVSSGTPRYVEPTAEEAYDSAPRLPRSGRVDEYGNDRKTQSRYVDDYDDAERGFATRPSQDSRIPNDNPQTRDSEKPLYPVAEQDFSRFDGTQLKPTLNRTFTQNFQGTNGSANGAPSLDFKNMTRQERREVIRLPWYYWMDSSLKNHIVASIGELVGTTMFLFFAFSGTAVANIPDGSGSAGTTTTGNTGFDINVQLYIALAFGFSLMVNAWVFYRISGGLFNPAVTLGLMLIRAITPTRAAFVFIAQMAGGVAAAGLAEAMFPTQLNVKTTLQRDTSLVQGVFIEAVLTFELVFTIFMLAAEKHRATFVAPVGIGLALFIAEMTGVYYTGGSLNPARSFGPCVITGFNIEHWIYWVGPGAGSLFAVILYKVIKLLQYEFVNPGQDSG